MSSSFQNEIPKARVNLKLDLHTGGEQKKVELPLKHTNSSPPRTPKRTPSPRREPGQEDRK